MTPAGRRPVKEFLATLSDSDAAEVVAAMKEVGLVGLSIARHLRGDVYEVRADGDRQSYRVLFAKEGARGKVLLAIHAFSKKSQKTPAEALRLAEVRLAYWRRRGAAQRTSS